MKLASIAVNKLVPQTDDPSTAQHYKKNQLGVKQGTAIDFIQSKIKFASIKVVSV